MNIGTYFDSGSQTFPLQKIDLFNWPRSARTIMHYSIMLLHGERSVGIGNFKERQVGGADGCPIEY